MANLKEVRERITSVISTQQITKAMKMVSAAKLRKAQGAIQQMRPYSIKLNEMLSNILSNLDGDAETTFGQARPVNKACVVVVTSNRGLCGGFNSNIIKAAAAHIDERYASLREKNNLSIICVGRKGFDFFRKRYADCNIIDQYVNLFDDLSFDNTVKVPQMLMEAFQSGQFDSVEIVYARFRNAAMQDYVVEPFLPVAKSADTKSKEKGAAPAMKVDFIFEPGKKQLLNHLVPSILQTQFQKTLLDTHASEHGARMTAMDAATNNAEDLLKELKISYNKARQEAITKELSEIVGGVAALEG